MTPTLYIIAIDTYIRYADEPDTELKRFSVRRGFATEEDAQSWAQDEPKVRQAAIASLRRMNFPCVDKVIVEMIGNYAIIPQCGLIRG